MNRRNFLKRIAAVAASAVAIPSVLLVASEVKAIKVPWTQMSTEYHYSNAEIKRACNTTSSGVIQEQLRELIEMTLKDMPSDLLESAWTTPNHNWYKNS